MTGRRRLHAHLDAAVEQRTITLLQGLPRVGRSRLIADWLERRPDAAPCSDPAEVAGSDTIAVLDQFDQARVPALVSAVRASEMAGGRTRFVVAPNDLSTSFAIRDALTGAFEAIEVTPLQLDELDDGPNRLSSAMGPMAGALSPMPEPLPASDPAHHWLRGGFPESLAASTDELSLAWRRQLIEPLLERDYTRWGLHGAFQLQALLRWLALRNSAEIDDNTSKFGKRAEFNSAVFVLEKLGLVRRLRNIAASERTDSELKDKLFARDTGLLHSMLGIVTREQLEQHKAVGASFESYAIEALIVSAGAGCGAQFYRLDNGQGEDEIDLILDLPNYGGGQIAIEFKVGPNRRSEPGFFRACAQLGIDEQLVIHSGTDSVLDERIPRLDLRSAMRRIAEMAAA